MNERIKQLADEAESSANEVFDFDGRGYYDIVMAKFAELIVKECIETLRLVPYNSDREFGDEVIYQDAIRKHFGVEE